METITANKRKKNYHDSVTYIKRLETEKKISKEDREALTEIFTKTYAQTYIYEILTSFSIKTSEKLTKSVLKLLTGI